MENQSVEHNYLAYSSKVPSLVFCNEKKYVKKDYILKTKVHHL